ncbi:hypothetical protein DPMN_168725 [Dreissena polymorpha]|uniref:Uncharacterized protein n=1 Tax=Dreissena polymorpha TaxID=45954 RepID=A0A9D4F2H4_DREPO|nr:hypothetical protein DPMN_168725 [Dreissena polymorpha]
MIVTELYGFPHVIKQHTRKIYQYSRASWPTISEAIKELSATLLVSKQLLPIENLLETLKIGSHRIVDKHVPSKMCKHPTLAQERSTQDDETQSKAPQES